MTLQPCYLLVLWPLPILCNGKKLRILKKWTQRWSKLMGGFVGLGYERVAGKLES